jgi:hypothetical protein
MNSTVKVAESIGAVNRDITTSEGQISARAQLTDAFGGKRKRQAASAKQRYGAQGGFKADVLRFTCNFFVC